MLTPPSTKTADSVSTSLDAEIDEFRMVLRQNAELIDEKCSNSNGILQRLRAMSETNDELGELLNEAQHHLMEILGENDSRSGIDETTNRNMFSEPHYLQDVSESMDTLNQDQIIMAHQNGGGHGLHELSTHSPQDFAQYVQGYLKQVSHEMNPRLVQSLSTTLDAVMDLASHLPLNPTNMNNVNELVASLDRGIAAFKE